MPQNTVIIGGGPAGHELALRLGRNGQNVTLIESTHMGGTCLNVGCIPTKAYLAKAKLAKTLRKLKIDISTMSTLGLDSLQQTTFRTIGRLRLAMEQSLLAVGVSVISDTVKSLEEGFVTLTSGITIPYDIGVLATGTTPWIPSGLEAYMTRPNVYTNETIFSMVSWPKNITIIGGGAIGVEFAFIFSALGTTVTLIEVAPSILGQLEPDLAKEVKRQLKLQRVMILEGVSNIEDHITLPEAVLIATGRQARCPNTHLPISRSTKGFINTNESFQTSHPHWYAIGDINGKSLLAHAANDQAAQLAEFFIHGKIPIEKPIPSVVYSLPAVASVGLRSNEKPEGAIITNTSYSVLGKAHMEEASEGWVRLIHHHDQLLGFHGFGAVIEDLIPLIQLAIQEKLSLKMLATLVAPHPSYGEILKLAIENTQ